MWVYIFCAKTKPLKVYHFHTGGTKSSHYEGGEYDIQPLEDECLMFSDSCSFVWLALLCFTVAVDFLFCFYSVVWFGLQWAAGKSQWRCRPKQPGLKWLCECSVRDSFRACGKPAHSLLTVAMRERVRRRKVEGKAMIWTDSKCAGIWEIKGKCRCKVPFCGKLLCFPLFVHPYIQLTWALCFHNCQLHLVTLSDWIQVTSLSYDTFMLCLFSLLIQLVTHTINGISDYDRR